MSGSDYERLRAIFLGARELDGAERGAYLESRCGGDAGLRADVEALLASDAPTEDGFLQSPALGGRGAADAPGTGGLMSRDEAPKRIGPYHLLQEIGEGGFGVVFMAEQSEPIRRRVALKIIKLGMDTKQVIARFEAERQALAMMDHPNIARVLDAGATETGRPYFVMELVKGVPITEYCDKARLGLRERLALFVDVCHAVQHAHQKGIIHRDIKPSNVMITLHDGRPVPKVIDFGIAKATSQRLTEHTLFTQYGQFIGTPEYMSPEQAEMSGLDVDTRSDIYSLGVLLYELLTGTTPFDGKTLREKAFAEIQRIIREQDPERPSTRVSTLGGASAIGIGESNAQRLRMLRGDLDWIVLKAMEKDRSRRYETANGLASDIDRYLTDEPVLAGPPRAGYRVRKFVKRHRGQVVGACLIATVLVLGVLGTVAGLVWALDEKQRADEAARLAAAAQLAAEENAERATESAARAEQQLERATQIKDFVIRMFTSLSPDFVQDVDVRLFETVLALAREDLEGGGLEDPEVRGELFRTMGSAYHGIGRAETAAEMFEEAYENHRVFFGENHEETLTSMLLRGIALSHAAYLNEALEVLRPALERSKEHLGEDSPIGLTIASEIAFVLCKAGRFDEALEYAEFAYFGAQDTLGEEDFGTTSIGATYAFVLRGLGREDEVAELEEASLRGFEREFPEGHWRLLMERFNALRRQRADGVRSGVIAQGKKIASELRRNLGDENWLATLFEQEVGEWMIQDGREEEAVEFLSEVVERMAPSKHWLRQHRLAYSYLEHAARVTGRIELAESTARDAVQVPGYPLYVFNEIETLPAYTLTGFMGGVDHMHIREFVSDPEDLDRGAVFRFTLNAGAAWGGLAWQDPANNWGQFPGGFDLSGADRLVFEARSIGGDATIKVGVGLKSSDYMHKDSGHIEQEFALTTAWQRFEIDLDGVDLSRILSGLVVALEGGENEVVVELDRVRYEQD